MDSKNRKYPRLNLSCDIGFSIARPEEITAEKNLESSETKDISIGGVCFIAYTELKKGTIINLQFKLKKSEKPIVVKGEVTWTEMFEIGGQKGWDIGIEFIKISDKDREAILEYIKLKI